MGNKVKLGDLISRAKVERCGEREFPVYSMTMHNGIVEQEDRFKKVIASRDRGNYKVVRKNQLIVGFPIDEGVLYVQNHDQPGIMSPAYNVWNIDCEKVLPAYLEFALHSPQSMAYYARKMRGTTARRRTLTADALRSMEIMLPSMERQQDIVDMLVMIKSEIAATSLIVGLLDSLIKSQFIKMFGDLKSNDCNWPVLAFDRFARIDTRMTADFERYANMPHIGIDSIESTTGKLRGFRTVREDRVRSGKYLFTSNHIIYSKIRPALNKVALPDFSGVCSADAYPILPNAENCDRVFLAYVMRSEFFLDYILPLSKRAQMPKVNKKALSGFEMPLPPLGLQREFAAFVAQVDKSKCIAQKQIEKLQLLYDSLAQEYFGD